jgi:hypothetical protein
MLIPAVLVAHDETAVHAQLHIGSSAVVMTVAAAIALVWSTTRRRSESVARTAVLSALSLLAFSQLAESGGAYAWESDGTTLQSPVLHVVHTAAAVTGAVALFAVGGAAVAALATLAVRVAPLLRAGTTVTLLALALGVAAGSAGASSIVYVKSNSIWVVPPNGKHPTKLTSGSRKFASPSQADDGTVVALGDDNHLYRFSRAGRQLGAPIATWLGLGGGHGFAGLSHLRDEDDLGATATPSTARRRDERPAPLDCDGCARTVSSSPHSGASLGTNGWRIPAWSAALAAATWGTSSLSTPNRIQPAAQAVAEPTPRSGGRSPSAPPHWSKLAANPNLQQPLRTTKGHS